MSDLTAVEQANTSFYQAFETLDLTRMDLVWSHGEHVKCVHPGWQVTHASSPLVLARTSDTENIFSEVHGRLAVTSVLATNLFEHTTDGWRLVHHHASHVFSAAPDSDSTNY